MKKGEFGQYRKLIRKLQASEAAKMSPRLARKIDELFKATQPRDPADWWKTPNK